MPAGDAIQQNKYVFLNVPFDAGYEKLFVALITSIVSARLVPRCAVELPERGEGQLKRIMTLMADCSVSIHDLSRANRFNMPFELGIAAALNVRENHQFIIMEAGIGGRFRTPSDLRGIAPLAHGKSPSKLMAGILDNLGGTTPVAATPIYRRLVSVLPRLKNAYQADTIFCKAIYRELVSGAVEEAQRLNLLAS